MKTILAGAMAFLLAAPTFAQAAPAADPHAGHAQHQGMDHSKHADHKAEHDCAKCCEEAKASGKPMECGMDKAKKAAPAAPAKPDAHQH